LYFTFFIVVILTGVRFHCGFNFHFLGHWRCCAFFSCICWSFVHLLLRNAHFFHQIVCYLSSVHILDTNSLSGVWLVNIFHSIWFLFSSLILFLHRSFLFWCNPFVYFYFCCLHFLGQI
jgi:hypothetical protein